MTTHTVTTQAELDAALADDAVTHIEIRSERGVWLTIGDTGTTEVAVAGESTIESCSGRVGRVTGSGRVGRVTGSGRVGEVTGSGRVGDTLTPDDGPLAGVEVAVLYKAVRDDLRSHHGFAYPIGELVSCEDWEDTDACGAGLHLSPSPREARDYDSRATRYLACHVPVTDLRPITDSGTAKCKTPRVLAVYEVDIDARPLVAAAVA